MTTNRRLDRDAALEHLHRLDDEIQPRVRRALKAHAAQHLPSDAEWLADLLHAKAKAGDRRASRMYGKLLLRLTTYGARPKSPTWPMLTSPERRAELAAILKENE